MDSFSFCFTPPVTCATSGSFSSCLWYIQIVCDSKVLQIETFVFIRLTVQPRWIEFSCGGVEQCRWLYKYHTVYSEGWVMGEKFKEAGSNEWRRTSSQSPASTLKRTDRSFHSCIQTCVERFITRVSNLHERCASSSEPAPQITTGLFRWWQQVLTLRSLFFDTVT